MGIMLQMTAPLTSFLKGGYSKVFNINIISYLLFATNKHTIDSTS